MLDHAQPHPFIPMVLCCAEGAICRGKCGSLKRTFARKALRGSRVRAAIGAGFTRSIPAIWPYQEHEVRKALDTICEAKKGKP